MDPIEQRVRDSLRARAEGAEPTPQLYRGVQARIARRRRQKLLAWVPAGAAALGVAVAVPFLLTSGGPEVPRIEDYSDQLPMSPATPDRAVIHDVDGGMGILDLREGTVTDSGVQTPPQGPLTGLAVPAADRGDDPAWVALEQAPGTEPSWTIFRPGVSEVSATFPSVIGDGGMAVSDDGGWVAYLTRGEEADGYVVTVANTLLDGEMEIHTFGNVSEDARILDWGGPIERGSGAMSEILVATANGTLTSFEVVGVDGELTAVSDPVTVEDAAQVLAASLTHDGSPEPSSSRYQLEQVGNDRHVRLVGETSGELDVTGLVGEADAADLWLDAWGDATLLGDGRSVWLLRHDGEGDFATPVALPEGTVRAALVGKDVAPPEPEPQPEPTPEVTPPGEEGIDDGDVEEAPAVQQLPGPIVVTTADAVVLRRADGSEVDLLRYPAPPGMNLEAAVRPGSTPDDLTVVVARTSEGLTDLRWIEVAGGEVLETPMFQDAYAPLGATDPGVRLNGLAWTPDGSKLLWMERHDDGPATLRTIGWDGGPGTGDTATDNASFEAPFAFDAGLVDVLDVGGGRLVARFASQDDNRGWYRWVLEVQGDGALAIPAGSEPELVTSPVSQGGVTALAGADDESRPTWLLIFEFEGPRLVADPFGSPRDVVLPDGVAPGDGLPETWLHVLGDGVIVGGSGQAWFIDADGGSRALGEAVDADPLR
ncbi:hypothetical protein [Nitriliruptor alkaliphilus]|uniref:hypothetical protein n=1 Tax=Nitriliruptor alkaliphilus TaxID=427918 RepID=UPI000698C8B6|nr:hypothetical protein [Nitriliruptor alkaliphilus]